MRQLNRTTRDVKRAKKINNDGIIDERKTNNRQKEANKRKKRKQIYRKGYQMKAVNRVNDKLQVLGMRKKETKYEGQRETSDKRGKWVIKKNSKFRTRNDQKISNEKNWKML